MMMAGMTAAPTYLPGTSPMLDATLHESSAPSSSSHKSGVSTLLQDEA